MGNLKRFLKKSTALLLSVLMIVTSIGVTQVFAVNSDETINAQLDNVWTGTAGELVANNYTELNDKEKAILANSAIAGATYSVAIPTDNDEGLVTVDADAQTVTAKPYTVDGFTWEPTSAVIKYTNLDGTAGTDIKVTLNKSGDVYVGNFKKPANSYRAEVTYALMIPVAEADQKLLLNTPYYLAEGYSQINSTSALKLAVNAIEEKMEDLRVLYNGITYSVDFSALENMEGMDQLKQLDSFNTFINNLKNDFAAGYTIGLSGDSNVKKYLGNILADYDKNGSRSTLSLDLDAYNTAKSKVQYMMESGAQLKGDISWFYSQMEGIVDNSDELLGLADQLKNLATGTGEGTIADAKNKIDNAANELAGVVEDAVQELINKAIAELIKKINEMPLASLYIKESDFDSLKGKTRKDNAVYTEIEAKRVFLEQQAAKVENISVSTNNPTLASFAAMIRTDGIGAMDLLEEAIRTIYAKGDEAVATLLAKKADLDVYAETALAKATEVEDIVTGANGSVGLGDVLGFVADYENQEWKFIGKKLLKDGVTDEEYQALDVVVKAAYDSVKKKLYAQDHSDVAIKEKLLACETVISAMVDQYVVNVNVAAAVVPLNSQNSEELVSLEVGSINFPMDKGVAASDVFAAIEASGIEKSTLGNWDKEYNVGEANYYRTVVIKDKEGNEIDSFEALLDDVTYTITYSPKKYKINENYTEGTTVTEVPYGYNWLLPRPAELSKSYEYKIDGVAHRENTVVRIVKDIEVTRKEGKALASKKVAQLIAAGKFVGTALSDKEKNVLNSDAFKDEKNEKIYYRTPDSSDKLAKVTAIVGSDNEYKVVAEPMSAGIVGSDAAWIPVSAYVVKGSGSDISFTFTKVGTVYEATFKCDKEFSSVQIAYQLSVDAVEFATVKEFLNIANTLEKDVAEQKADLDQFLAPGFYSNLGTVNNTLLGSIGTMVSGMSAQAREALAKLTDECINPTTGSTYLYEYLTQYQKDGIAYYYKGENAANIQKQIALINELLPKVWNDAAVQDTIVSMGMESQSPKVEAVLNMLSATTLKPVNALVNTKSSFVDALLATVQGEGSTSSHNVADNTFVLEANVSASAPGLTSYAVEIQVLNKNDGVVETFKKEAFGAQGKEISAVAFEAMYNELLATIPNNKYYVAEKNLPTSAVVLKEEDTVYTSVLRPKTYTVKVEGAAEQVLYAFDAYTIILPGTGVAGLKYKYTYGTTTVEVLSGALENYSLGTDIVAIDALFGANAELVITRELIDINRENLINFVGKLNNAFANGGLVSGGKLAVAFIPVEDANGNLSIVLRITNDYGTLSPAALASEMTNLIQDLSYVGLNGSPLFGLNSDNEMKLYIQTIINMLVNSNLGFDSIANMIDANGNIKEMKLAGATVIGAKDNKIVLDNAVINNVDQFGGKLMESTMQYGVNINNTTSAAFYVTYQDFDSQAELLKKVKKGIEQIRPYLNLNFKEGAVNVAVNAPDSVYAYFLASMLIVGQVEFDSLQDYELKDLLEYFYDLVAPVFDTEGISSETFINTIEQTGFYSAIADFDTEANRALIDFFYNTFDHLFDSIAFEGSSNGGKYNGVLTYEALDVLLNNKIDLGDMSSMIAEKDTGLALPVAVELKNRETEYQAMVLDIKASGIVNKYYMSRNIVADISKVSDNGVVILISNVHGNMTINNDIILNLNGCTISGDITAKGNVSVVDSTLGTKDCGSVVGKLIANGGNFTLSAGKYLSGAEKYLEAGYYLKENVVTNGIFNIAEENGELNLYLGTDYMSLDEAAAKVMATDLLFKLWFNYYHCSELVIDGNVIYSLNLHNVTESLNDLSVLIGKAVEVFDCEGASAFATQFMDDVTDFGALADALENGTPLVSYTIQNAAFNPFMKLEGEGDDAFFSFNVEAATDNKQITHLNVLLDDDVPADHQTKMIKVLRELDNVVSFNALEVEIEDVTYDSKGFSAIGAARADAVIDLSKNVNYPVIIGSFLAYNAKGAKRAELVEAIKYYQTSNSAIALQKAIETATASEITAALKATKSMSFSSVLKALGITANDAVELESLYTLARKVVSTVVDHFDISGGNASLASIKVSGEYATYKYAYTYKPDTYAQMTLVLFAEEKAITVKDESGIIYLNTDSLAEAFAAAREGATIYINKPVVLDKNVVLPAVAFKLVNAKNIDFAGMTLEFVDGNTTLTTDEDIAASIICNSEEFCSEVICTKVDNWFVYAIEGGQHEWEIIPAVAPDCEKPGSTEGEWCKNCHKYKDGKEPQPISPLGHAYTETVVEPTCYEEGYTLHTCGNCGDTYVTDRVAATNHIGTTETVKGYPATCTENGLTDGEICTKCGYVVKAQEVIKAHHTLEDYNKAPTCTEDGVANASKCSVCGEMVEQGEVIPATGHGMIIVEGKAPTCTEDGYTSSVVCPNGCGHVFIAPIPLPALGHTIVTDAAKEPTCTETGLTEGSHCSVCGEVFAEQTEIPATGHTKVIDPAKAPTETETGLTEGSHCSVCGEVFVEQKELAKLPKIHIPEPNVDTEDGIIRGAKVDADNKLIYLDVNPAGFTAKEFAEVYFKIDNASKYNISIYKYGSDSFVRGNNELVCTGDTVKVVATNKDGVEVSVTYNIVIMGDTNCDGILNSRDVLQMKLAYVDELSLEGYSAMAADMNFDGKLNSRDTVLCETKYVLWDENGYVSQTK